MRALSSRKSTRAFRSPGEVAAHFCAVLRRWAVSSHVHLQDGGWCSPVIHTTCTLVGLVLNKQPVAWWITPIIIRRDGFSAVCPWHSARCFLEGSDLPTSLPIESYGSFSPTTCQLHSCLWFLVPHGMFKKRKEKKKRKKYISEFGSLN